jgi:hypothetical protein
MLGHWPDASISSGSKSKQAGSLQIDLNMIDKINDGVGQIQIRDKPDDLLVFRWVNDLYCVTYCSKNV